MDVDNYQSYAENSSGPQSQIVDSNPGSPEKTPKERIIELLDQVEMHVERLRRDALKLEEEKDTLLTTLDTLRNSEMMIELTEAEREEVCSVAESVTSRCLTVDVCVRTTRDPPQEEALHRVNGFIDSLVVTLRSDPSATKARCIAFMNACSAQHHDATDKNFEQAILGCALDDQKRVKKRLQGLLDYIDQQRDMLRAGDHLHHRHDSRDPAPMKSGLP